jgi:hypothetical protein
VPRIAAHQRVAPPNAAYALAALKQEGGSSVATSVFLYCEHTINATGDLSAPPWVPKGAKASLLLNAGCVDMVSGLTTMDIGSESMVHHCQLCVQCLRRRIRPSKQYQSSFEQRNLQGSLGMLNPPTRQRKTPIISRRT